MSTIQAESTASSPSALPDSALLLIDARAKEPIRAELLGLEHLEALARRLAAACVPASPRRAASPLLRRFEDNGKVLGRAHRRILREAPARDEGGGLEAEWLVDNYHIIEDVLREVRQDLPPGYDEELPKLAAGALKGYPRVYALALALVAHTDGELHEDRISGFVQAFQAVSPLTIGELWAVPIMLRLVLLENLRRLADQMRQSRDERQQAQDWAARNLAGTGPGGRADPFPCLTGPFVVRLRQLALRAEPSPVAAAALERLEAELARRGDDPDEVLRREHDRQAANPVSIGNCVVSLRLLSAIDWNTFFEEHSRVEAILRADPAGVYPLQDFATRDRYRKELERIARWSGADQLEVARRVVELAGAATPRTAQNHVGFSLIGPGQGGLKAEFGSRPPWRERLLNGTLDHPEAVYFGSIAALWVLLLAALATLAGASGANSFQLALTLAALLLPAGEVAVRLVNHLITLLLPPRTLPKMDFLRGGIPDDCATFVVMPSMLTSRRGTAELLERLEIHYLADPDPNFVYALLTDYADAPHEHLPEDRGYLDAALEGIRALNRRYAPGGPDKFFLLHRHRQWNPVQGCWMGWERKRGKLSEFNRLLRGTLGTSYSTISGDLGPWIRQIRFVITLDADTQVPRNSARRMVATLAHPLNQPRFDPDQGRVVAGYGILQPRVGFHLLAPTRSRFSGILAASAGIDPYATAVSDHYMDLFGTGSFTGKGIYDVDAFEAATGSTFPENRILSHDLIEGNYARCGLVTDVELFDDFPARYHAYARREHRWVRGDWQILPWLGRRVPTAAGGRVANPLPVVERWKIFDNLRRSLVPPALVVLLALGWTVLPGSPWLWTAAALAVPALPLIKQIFGTLVRTVRGRTLAGLRQWRDSVPATATQALLATAFLADQARLLVDATARTLVRLYVTRRNLLEWETAAATESRLRTTIGQFYATMWPAPALAVALLGLIVAAKEPGKRTEALLAAGPILAAWFVSPVVAFWVSRPRPTAERPLADVGRRALRRVARKTWLFFETFVGDDDHWLPPDNFQEEPDGR
ncbi:MAG TPA: glycosyl transferase family 36, partial [Isosphaeraceae bacterium]